MNQLVDESTNISQPSRGLVPPSQPLNMVVESMTLVLKFIRDG